MDLRKLLSAFAFQSFITSLILLTSSHPVSAHKSDAFDSLQIGLQYVSNTNRGTFHDFWKQTIGFEGFVEMPFYLGDVQVGVQVLSYTGNQLGVPGFQNLFIYAGWGKRWALPTRLSCFAGLSIGNNIMIFEREAAKSYRLETEYGVNLNARLGYRIYEKWSIDISGSYLVVFTHKQIRLAFLSAGISRSFGMPKWLKEFLR